MHGNMQSIMPAQCHNKLAIRGNVVLEDANQAIVDLTGATNIQVTIGATYTGTHPEEWIAVGKPACWMSSINPRQCHGDADGAAEGTLNFWVSMNDLEILIGAWNKPLSALLEIRFVLISITCPKASKITGSRLTTWTFLFQTGARQTTLLPIVLNNLKTFDNIQTRMLCGVRVFFCFILLFILYQVPVFSTIHRYETMDYLICCNFVYFHSHRLQFTKKSG